MRYILFFAAFLISSLAHGQGTWNKSSTNNAWNRTKADSVAIVPRDTSATNNAILPSTGQPVGDYGRIQAKHGLFYFHDSIRNRRIAFYDDIPSLTGYVPNTRTIQISSGTDISAIGGTQDLSANRTWTINNTSTLFTVLGRDSLAQTNYTDGKTIVWDAAGAGAVITKGLRWSANTDYGRIYFQSSGDGANDSRLKFVMGDNDANGEGFEFLKDTAGLSGGTGPLVSLQLITLDQFKYRGNNIWHVGIDPSGSAFIPTLTGANVFSSFTTGATGRVTAATTRTLTAADISAAPVSGSANYIQNQISSAQTAESWITGRQRAIAFEALSAAGSGGIMLKTTGSLLRWLIRSNTAETGSGNTGSDLTIFNFDDAGTTISQALVLKRSNGYLGINPGGVDPTSFLSVSGSVAMATNTVTVTTALTSAHHTLNFNNSANVDANLPAAASCPGRIYVIKKISNNAFTVSIDPNGSETIEGTTTPITLTTYLSSITIQSDGSGWWVY